MTVYKLYNFYNVWAAGFLHAYQIRAWKLYIWDYGIFIFVGNYLRVQEQCEIIQYKNSDFVYKR